MSGIIPKLIRNVLIRTSNDASHLTIKNGQKHSLGPALSICRNDIHTSALKANVFKPGAGRRVIIGETKGITPNSMRGPIYDESDDTGETLSALESAHVAEPANENENIGSDLYPDETTADKIFNGIKYRDLPYVTIKCTKNNTRFWAHSANKEILFYTSPTLNGFMNAKKRSNVAAQATGLVAGQKLRQMNQKTIRVRIDGFNLGRLSSLNGILQAGINIVSISDVTVVDWGWCQRAKKPKRRN